jgi:hypothetical protein
MTYKNLGLLACTLLVVGLAFVVYKWPLDRHKTFSRRAATNMASITYYFALFLTVLTLFIIFFIEWFTPTFGISWWFNGIFIASAIFQIACTLTPDKGGRMSEWHGFFAGTSALLLAPPLIILIATGDISMFARIVTFVSLGIMAICSYLALRAPNHEPLNFLLLQCLYYGSFLVPILSVSYLL